MLDVFFFNCGSVTLTVSGDIADFRIKDVEAPLEIQRTIERVCLGELSIGLLNSVLVSNYTKRAAVTRCIKYIHVRCPWYEILL